MNDTAPTTFPWPERSYPGKRALDVAMALGGLLLCAPLLAVVVVAVKLTSRGPVFYRGKRAGLCGRTFTQLKIRTMTIGAAGDAFTAAGDPRVTRLGHLLRGTKIDELPQLVNVLWGDMSIVGPRPEDARLVDEFYTRDALRVLAVRPGMTCLVQVRVFPDFTSQVPPGADPQQYYRQTILPARLEEDLEYVDRLSLALDLKICLQTAWCLLVRSWWVPLRRQFSTRPAERLVRR